MSKYLIKARIQVDGVVEKHDIIGALFGQTEGLFGEQFDLKVLQDKGRVGRIIVNTKTQGGKTVGEIQIPSNLDRVETALLAAMIESVDRVGPYDARLEVVEIIDLRIEKIKKIVDRAVEILKKWSKEKAPDLKEIVKDIQDLLKIPEPISYGKDQLPAGPDVDKSDTVIIVEGRADVINLLRYGITNAIAIGGARKIPETVKELSKKKKTIVFVDGDHVGELILRELLRNIKVDLVALAPQGKEVEELTGKDIEEALSKAVDYKTYLENLIKQGVKEAQQLLQAQEEIRRELEGPRKEEITLPASIQEDVKSLIGTLEAILYDQSWNKIKRIPTRDLVDELSNIQQGSVHAIVFDGIVTQRLVDKASEKNVKIIIGAKIGKLTTKPPELLLLTFSEFT
ncbi:DNA primase DnaG [Thermogladius sp. 4427co]|uniref:DNA primase DnaG n=1 Tax=Thermogladius sp. 4427co TaxID=3450718 RepID=UPI003F79E217